MDVFFFEGVLSFFFLFIMASGKELKNRIKSITSIQKITKAMKMVAASKLRQVQNHLEYARPGFQAITSILDEMQEQLRQQQSSTEDSIKIDRKLLVVVSSDRGLCGGINSNVVKETRQSFSSSSHSISLLTIGEKSKEMLLRTHSHSMTQSFSDTAKRKISFAIASLVAEQVLQKRFDLCEIIFNRFKSVISQHLIRSSIYSPELLNHVFYSWNDYEFDSSKSDVLYDLYEYHLAHKIYLALLENATSEQGARMNAMDSASRNANEMIDKLTLTYNKARQAAITRELIEIISCASAVAK